MNILNKNLFKGVLKTFALCAILALFFTALSYNRNKPHILTPTDQPLSGRTKVVRAYCDAGFFFGAPERVWVLQMYQIRPNCRATCVDDAVEVEILPDTQECFWMRLSTPDSPYYGGRKELEASLRTLLANTPYRF